MDKYLDNWNKCENELTYNFIYLKLMCITMRIIINIEKACILNILFGFQINFHIILVSYPQLIHNMWIYLC